MSITWSDVTAIAPELTSTAVPTATQTVLLAIVDRQIDDSVWLDLADDGRRYLAAHLGTLYSSDGSAGGEVTSESLGPMSRSYSTSSTSESGAGSLGTTKYGVFYLHLLRLLPSHIGFVP